MSGDFSVGATALPEVFTIERARRGDHRGFLSRLFSADELSGWGWDKPTAQINHTYTAARGTIRGMHFQVAPKAEKKIIMCLKGAVCDVRSISAAVRRLFFGITWRLCRPTIAGRFLFPKDAGMGSRR